MMRIFSFLALAGLGVATLASLITMCRSVATGRQRRACATFGAWVGGLGIYTMLLFGVSFASREQVLPPGAEKRFCALDCDLAYSVAAVRSADPLVSRGRGLIVTVRARSDARAVTMRPSDFAAWIVTTEGGRIDPVPLQPRPEAGALGPGESKFIDLRFEFPAEARIAGLEIAEGGWPTRFVIGDENSLLHRKILLRLPPPAEPTSRAARTSQEPGG